ncbi:MAG: VanZ family protein [Peptostreptococcaceae bacterium]
MSISAIFRMASGQLVLGIILTTLAIAIFLVGYFFIYKRMLKGTKKLKVSKVAQWGILLIYIIVVLGATLGIRSTGYEGSTSLQLFISYKEAWNSFSKVEWRNIILNILMFVPLGVLLPIMFKTCQKFWVTYLVGFSATIILEVIQLITKRGIFEIDDIFNNTLGCLIGYGIVMILISLFKYKKSSEKIKPLTLAYFQIPLCITIVAFSTIFITYSRQELGNLSINYSKPMNMSNISVGTNIKFNKKLDKAFVYNASIGTKEETLEVANEVLSTVNAKVDESQKDVYDNTIVYRSEDGNYSVWVEYTGLTTWYSDFNHLGKDGKEGLEYEEVKALINEYGIELPENAQFKDDGEGNYSVTADMVEIDDILLNGQFTCTIEEDGNVSGFTNKIITYSKYKEYNVISQQEAYEKILNGEFKSYIIDENSKIEINDVKLSYEMDSKGFYQPVYEFSVKLKNDNRTILIPALQKTK